MRMPNRPPPRRRRSSGIAAVELALVMPTFFVLIACTLLFGQVLLNYQTACKASHDAVRYLSSVSPTDMQNPARVADHTTLARAIVTEEMGSLMSSGLYAPVVTILCGGAACTGFSTPNSMSVIVQMYVANNVLPGIILNLFGFPGVAVTATSTLPYVGR
ncbi:TadE family protein [Rugamonas aquatica]|nr:TadE/TadG family type IV pilus assembly protein [Rugamonas aquatica]